MARSSESDVKVEGSIAREFALSAAAAWRLVLLALVGIACVAIAAPAALADEFEDDEPIVVSDGEEEDEVEDEEIDWSRTGPYVLGMGHYAIQEFKHQYGLDWNDVGGASLRVGYRIIPRLSLEMQAEWENFDTNNTGQNFDAWTLAWNWRAYFTDTRIAPYMLFGVGALMARGDVSGNDVILRVGGGIDWNITKHIAIVTEVQYVPALDNLKDYDFLSIGGGVQYRF